MRERENSVWFTSQLPTVAAAGLDWAGARGQELCSSVPHGCRGLRNGALLHACPGLGRSPFALELSLPQESTDSPHLCLQTLGAAATLPERVPPPSPVPLWSTCPSGLGVGPRLQASASCIPQTPVLARAGLSAGTLSCGWSLGSCCELCPDGSRGCDNMAAAWLGRLSTVHQRAPKAGFV